MRVNRQIFREASSILYGESTFKAHISSSYVMLQAKRWYREPHFEDKNNDYTIEKRFSEATAKSIRNLDIAIRLGEPRDPPEGIDFEHEEQELLALRDSVRKFAGLFMSPSDHVSEHGRTKLRRITVRPSVGDGWGWKACELHAALFLVIEPLQLLRGIKHRRLESPIPIPWGGISESKLDRLISNTIVRKKYSFAQKAWENSHEGNHNDTIKVQEPNCIVKAGYSKIEAFVQLIYAQDAFAAGSWTSTVFRGIERPLHLARVAYETNDQELMEKIHSVIKARWISAHRRQQAQLRIVADSISSMFADKADGSTIPQEEFPDAFVFEDVKPITMIPAPHLWIELESIRSVPQQGDEGVVVEFSTVRHKIYKDGRQWNCLTMPATVRRAHELKKAAKS
ncbi:hypothetical protein ACN47E_003042 [Coniothyrium glycines]